MANLNGTNILGAVVPFTTDDVYSTHHAKYGKGGIRTVKDLTERDLIFSDRRENLMIVCVEDNSFISSTSGVAFYMLDINHNASTSTSLMDNNNWVLVDFGYGADGWVFPPPTQSLYNGNKGQRSFDGEHLYICVEDNLWKRVAIDWFVDGGTSGFGGTSGALNYGVVPIWGSNGEWEFDYVVKDIDTIFSTSGNLLITFTDNSSKILQIGQSQVVVSETYIDSSSGTLNVVYTDNFSTSFPINTTLVANLNDLLDVVITNATSGDVLKFDGSNWINGISNGLNWVQPPPASSYSTGNKGDASYDDNFVYICIQNNLWKRINIDYFLFNNSTSGTSGFSIPYGSVPFWNGSGYSNTFTVVNIQPATQMGTYGEVVTYSSGTSAFIPFGNSIINSGNYYGSNGITKTGNTFELGGTLNQNTIIDGTNFDLLLDLKDFSVKSDTISLSTTNFDANLNTMLLTQDVNLSFPNKSGTFALVENIHFKINNIYYVSKDGNNATGQKGVITRPYKDIKYVVNLAGANDYIHVFQGAYDEYEIPTKSNLTIYLEDGVKIEPTFNSGKVAIFTDLVLNQAALNFRILGYGELLSKGVSFDDTSCIVASYTNSKYYVEAKYVRSLEAWGVGGQIGAFIHIKNAKIDYDITAYRGGEILAENCYFLNLGRIVDSAASSLATEVKLTFNDCYFERNGSNGDYLLSYGNDTTATLVFSTFNNNINTTIYCNIVFNNCSFVQKLNSDSVYIKANKFGVNSCIQFNNCKFYNAFNTTKSIVYTTNPVFTTNNTTTYDNGNLKFIMNSNISNVDVDSVNVVTNITNEIPISGMYLSQYFRINNKK